jgi:chromate transporter
MHAELVERRRAVDEQRFFAALGFCNALPGPEAMQLTVWLGWR